MASKNVKATFEKAYKEGKLKVNAGEVITPGSVVRGVAKVAAKIGAKGAEKAATKVGQKVGQKIAEATKPAKYPKSAANTKTIRTTGGTTTKSTSGATSTTANTKSVTLKKAPLSEKQKAGIAAAIDTKRTKEIVRGAQSAKEAAKPVIKKEIAKKKLAQGAAAVITADDVRLRMKKNK